MIYFGTRFLICNVFVSLFILLLLLIKQIFKNHISSRTQYNVCFILFALLCVPFIPVHFSGFANVLSQLTSLTDTLSSTDHSNSAFSQSATDNSAFYQAHDFAVSVSSQAPSYLHIILLILWLSGICFMTIRLICSLYRLHCLAASSLPVQSQRILAVFNECIFDVGIKTNITCYSTAFIKAPFTTGIVKQRIYLPISVISDTSDIDMRYMLLHELEHCRHRDSIINILMNIAAIFYWFNPIVWYELNEIRCEREIACDCAVLQLISPAQYNDYGNTLINFAEQLSIYPFTSGISSSMKHMKRRILNISRYAHRNSYSKFTGITIYVLTASLMIGLAPVLSTTAATQDYYQFDNSTKNISYIDLSDEFAGYDGSFVMYDESNNQWHIYNEDNATKRVSPNSTYKIYDALLGLQSGIITPDNSSMTWNGEQYPFKEWEADQTLTSAMHNSVNWYFQSIDEIAGKDNIDSFLQNIGYGNRQIGNDVDLYWSNLSLKISPIEQVELLQKFNNYDLNFDSRNIDAVKNAIKISDTSQRTLFGKTGTGRVDNKDVNGWFIGYIEYSNEVYYFATNIQGKSDTTGSKARSITETILGNMLP